MRTIAPKPKRRCAYSRFSFETGWDLHVRSQSLERHHPQHMISDKPAAVVDFGTGYVKAGFAGDTKPRVVLPNCVGRPFAKAAAEPFVARSGGSALVVGDQALNKRATGLALTYPLQNGIVQDWEAAEAVWSHLFSVELGIDPQQHPVLCTEAPLNPRRNREQLATLVFEAFGVPAFFMVVQAVLALYATGRTTGAVLDLGDGVTHVVPVYDGYCLPHAVRRLNLAGRDLTDLAAKLLNSECGLSTHSRPSVVREIARQVKEQHCYVAPDWEAENHRFQQDPDAFLRRYLLPDGQELAFKELRFTVPECLFQPALMGMDAPGIHELLLDAIQKCDVDLRRSLYGGIVLSGGSSLFPGLPERLHAELAKQIPGAGVQTKIVAGPDRRFAVFQGGAVLAGLDTFEQMWITRAEYDEFGPQIVHRKCL
ncbi:actin-like protein [Cyanidioschyzon merolae strain 10D]|jgi:actin-related protein|uniref:Actin-like protein n=1 Tax=Cyanidioschyzon merolae (strain NIES-3377 / 10D) TaxID=280699 RepID=M1V7D1_CYAM1|nr:actin-like protein [Cyanidioschyzon merolae strain 10D]BAM82975.1 actin-like protein [Cyanidioschyzon merolae strain 10D]|eukprot:XP_005539011.1 actin-like protein [Cyanidioschyzon merolae strain 10D]